MATSVETINLNAEGFVFRTETVIFEVQKLPAKTAGGSFDHHRMLLKVAPNFEFVDADGTIYPTDTVIAYLLRAHHVGNRHHKMFYLHHCAVLPAFRNKKFGGYLFDSSCAVILAEPEAQTIFLNLYPFDWDGKKSIALEKSDLQFMERKDKARRFYLRHGCVHGNKTQRIVLGAAFALLGEFGAARDELFVKCA